jgi:Tol biopolymer transport system component
MKSVKALAKQGKLDEADRLLNEIRADLKNTSEAAVSKVLSTAPSVTFTRSKPRVNESDKFGIWIATLEGKNLKLIISDPKREMTHTRVSPDKKWIVFTRYNDKLKDGYAYEKGGYKNTETCIVRLDGSEVRTLAGPKPGILNCNASWAPDGKRIIFLSRDNPERRTIMYWMNIDTGEKTRVPTPDHLENVSDPHHVLDLIAFPSPPTTRGKPVPLWIMKEDGSEARQLTFPPNKSLTKGNLKYELGDRDPSISADGSKVAVFRYCGPDTFHVVVVDIATGKEVDLSDGVVVDGMPNWSSDGKLILFRHVRKKHLDEYGLYTMKPDGSDKKRVPLPRGVLHGVQPSFFPGEGSSPQARIVFSTVKVSYLD